MNKAYSRINWQNTPSTATPLSAANLNAMDSALDTIDDRVIALDTEKADTDADLSGFTQDSSHRTVTDTQIATWNGKADSSAIPTALSDLTDDATHRVVTDTEKSTWNGKADTSDIPTALSSLSDDSTHRLVTDTEKTTWNGKSVVSYNQIQATGTKIAEITINGTTTNIFAPTGGSGGGDMSTSTYDPNGDVATAGGIPAYVSTAITNAITNAIGGSY